MYTLDTFPVINYHKGMNVISISVRETRNRLAEVIERAAAGRDVFVVTKFGKPKVVITGVGKLLDKQKKKDRLRMLNKTFGLLSGIREDIESGEWVRRVRDELGQRGI